MLQKRGRAEGRKIPSARGQAGSDHRHLGVIFQKGQRSLSGSHRVSLGPVHAPKGQTPDEIQWIHHSPFLYPSATAHAERQPFSQMIRPSTSGAIANINGAAEDPGLETDFRTMLVLRSFSMLESVLCLPPSPRGDLSPFMTAIVAK